MRFLATHDQIKKLLAVATNASIPAGMGFFHFDGNKVFTEADFRGAADGADYVQGRMVKLYPREIAEGLWEIAEPVFDACNIERTYQSWGRQYPTATALIEAAGLTPEPEPQP